MFLLLIFQFYSIIKYLRVTWKTQTFSSFDLITGSTAVTNPPEDFFN